MSCAWSFFRRGAHPFSYANSWTLGFAAGDHSDRRGVLAAQTVLIPLALGVILAFMLTPLVRVFDRWKFPRFLGVALTMMIALGAVAGVGYVVFDQFADLTTQASKYTSSMRNKLADLPIGDAAAIGRLTRTVDRVTEQLDDNAADLRRHADADNIGSCGR